MNTKDIKRRIYGVQETAKITNAVHLIAASKMQRIKKTYQQSASFLEVATTLFEKIQSSHLTKSHVFFENRKEERISLVVIGGDKGLCGDYNQAIINATESYIQNASLSSMFVLGNVILEYFDKTHSPIINKSYVHIFPDPMPEDAKAIANDLYAEYLDNTVDCIYLIYTKGDRLLSPEIITEKLLPMQPLQQGEEVNFLYDEAAAFQTVAEQYVWARIYHAISSAAYVENYKRMVSMQEATNNAETISDDLKRKYNQERQASITSALLDSTISQMGRRY